MFRYQILIEYLGTSFVGWQIQKKGISIQKAIQLTLTRLLKQKIILYGSGRTDSGVHALEQSAHFDIKNKIKNIEKLVKSLNFFLNPKMISIINIKKKNIASPIIISLKVFKTKNQLWLLKFYQKYKFFQK